MGSIAEKFISVIYEMSSRKMFPDDVMENARDCLLDYVAVSLGGSKVNSNMNGLFLADQSGWHHVIGRAESVDLNVAVMVNAFNAHTLELDDGHRVAMTHLAAPICSAVWGVAESRGCPVKEVLHAMVVGYEVTIRLGKAIQPCHKKKGFHVTGTCGTVGSAMAVADLLGYSKSEMMNTLSAAATSGAGLLEVITGKSEQKPYNASHAAVAGVNAALFGKYFTGPDDILGGARGFMNVLSSQCNVDELVEPVTHYAIKGIYMKPYAACRHCHAPVEAALKLSKREQIPLDDISEIEVKTYDLAVYGHDHTKIDGINSAKMSIPYSVAVAYIKQQCGMGMFSEDAIVDEDVLSLAAKVTVSEDEQLSALVPQKRVAIVTVKMKTGMCMTERVDYPKGEPENPIGRDEIIEKFCSLASYADVSETDSRKVIDFVYNAKSEKIDQVLQILCKGRKEKS